MNYWYMLYKTYHLKMCTKTKWEAILLLFGCLEVNGTSHAFHLHANQSGSAKSTFHFMWYILVKNEMGELKGSKGFDLPLYLYINLFTNWLSTHLSINTAIRSTIVAVS